MGNYSNTVTNTIPHACIHKPREQTHPPTKPSGKPTTNTTGTSNNSCLTSSHPSRRSLTVQSTAHHRAHTTLGCGCWALCNSCITDPEGPDPHTPLPRWCKNLVCTHLASGTVHHQGVASVEYEKICVSSLLQYADEERLHATLAGSRACGRHRLIDMAGRRSRQDSEGEVGATRSKCCDWSKGEGAVLSSSSRRHKRRTRTETRTRTTDKTHRRPAAVGTTRPSKTRHQKHAK